MSNSSEIGNNEDKGGFKRASQGYDFNSGNEVIGNKDE